ncbi:hypothetical protein [Allokutzneria oryzae]|uniref:Uncharacterized protein n=1 Tax=Allokutzneria oryzae TaxID=1378989 RepID=A0ABV6A9C2_9PSEU
MGFEWNGRADGVHGRDGWVDYAHEPFIGDLLLDLAREGRLVLAPALADELISDLERTLDVVGERARQVESVRRAPPGIPREHPDSVVDALFVEQVAPRRMERALSELPKYVEALHLARERGLVEDADTT